MPIQPTTNQRLDQRLDPIAAQIWQAIADYQQANGVPPFLHEIKSVVPRGIGTIQHQLRKLESYGVLEITPYTQRGIRLLKQPGAPLRAKRKRPSDAPAGHRFDVCKNLLEARRFFWGDVMHCAIVTVAGVKTSFSALYPDGSVAAEVWIEPAEPTVPAGSTAAKTRARQS